MRKIVDMHESTPTRTAALLDVLRDDILQARLKPGEKLRFDALRKDYDVGISPLREALMHLASEGLVVSQQRKGYQVAPVSAEDLREIAYLRGEVDALAIAQSIAKGDAQWEGRVIGTFHALSKRSKLGADGEIDPDWEEYHVAFHTALVSECALPKLLAFRQILDLQARRYRRIAVHYLTAPRDDLGEHEDICSAVLDHDAERAGQLIRAHFTRTVDIILSTPGSTDFW